MAYCVYMLTSPDGKKYIGVTCEHPEKRWKRGKAYRKNTHLFRAIEKYGWDNFAHDVLFTDLTKEEAYCHEIDLIEKYNTRDQKCGYNHHPGGAGSNEGVLKPEEVKEKQRNSMRGKFVGLYVGGKSPKARRINQYSKDGEYIKTWAATTEVQRELGIEYTGIVRCCIGERLTAGGYIWRYTDAPQDVNKIVERINTPQRHTEEHKNAIRESMMGKRHKSLEKPIIATNTKTGEVRFYESISETQKDGFSPQNVSHCLSDRYPHSKSLKGFTFRYAS